MTTFLMIMTVYQTKVNKHITDKTTGIKEKSLTKQCGINIKAIERNLLLILLTKKS